jgi:predicted RNase H-like nuclease (RuvC/YqgF family)
MNLIQECDAKLIAAYQTENIADKETIALLKTEICEEKAKITMLLERLKQCDQMLLMSNEGLVFQLTKKHEREREWIHTIYLQMQ